MAKLANMANKVSDLVVPINYTSIGMCIGCFFFLNLTCRFRLWNDYVSASVLWYQKQRFNLPTASNERCHNGVILV